METWTSHAQPKWLVPNWEKILGTFSRQSLKEIRFCCFIWFSNRSTFSSDFSLKSCMLLLFAMGNPSMGKWFKNALVTRHRLFECPGYKASNMRHVFPKQTFHFMNRAHHPNFQYLLPNSWNTTVLYLLSTHRLCCNSIRLPHTDPCRQCGRLLHGWRRAGQSLWTHRGKCWWGLACRRPPLSSWTWCSRWFWPWASSTASLRSTGSPVGRQPQTQARDRIRHTAIIKVMNRPFFVRKFFVQKADIHIFSDSSTPLLWAFQSMTLYGTKN